MEERVDVRRRVWVQNVAVQATALEARLDVLARRHTGDPDAEEVIKGVRRLIQRAREAAYRDNPIPSRWAIWWRGTLIEASYQNLHAAEALIAELYSGGEIDAELPEAVARVEAGLTREDPRRARAQTLRDLPPGELAPAQLRKTIEIGYAAADRKHTRLRSFRNLVLGATGAIGVFVAVFVVIVANNPTWVPLCFMPDGQASNPVCATGTASASGEDVLIIALLGLLGGALAAAVAIRNLSGTATPYEVPAALALLKLPFGAMTALGVLIAIGGDFVPGLSNLDSQPQILTYALVFGYAQQLLTGLIDRRGESLLAAVPLKDASVPRPELGRHGLIARGLSPQ
jgi:hypothetical protein